MTQAAIRPLSGPTRANWIRLRTMIVLRWVAIAGQLVALTVAQLVYGMQLELSLCVFAVGISVIGNLAATFIFPENKRMSESENLGMILFDLLQLAFLLYLTGGLNNPFALLMLGPVTISAASLSLRSTIVLCSAAIILVSLLAWYHMPLLSAEGDVLRIPQLFVFGHWTALIIAILFSSAYSRRVTSEMNSMGDALAATQMALAREQKLTDLGGVVAAAAHELGTPLATIKLTSAELINDLEDQPELAEDAQLIRDQANRCRDILRDMGRAGKDDLHLKQAPLQAVIEEAAEPHLDRGIQVRTFMNRARATDQVQPTILRQPEVIHGLRNIIQNAVDFAKSQVWIEAEWDDQEISIRVMDDGRGFPASLLGRIGDPFMGGRRAPSADLQRPSYEGMGLGLFIAKTLLERSGAQLRFANGFDGTLNDKGDIGAVVRLSWPRARLEYAAEGLQSGLGENRRFEAKS